MGKECDERVARVKARWAERIKKKNIKIRELRRKLRACMKKKPNPPEPPPPVPPKPDKAIKSLEVRNGKFIVNGQPTKLYGVSKRGMIAVGSGDLPGMNYTYAEIKKALFASNINLIRVLAGKNLSFFRNEVVDFLAHGKNVHVELWDAAKPHRAYQAHWKDTFNAVKDLPVFFCAHNEFTEHGGINGAKMIVEYVVNRGCIISAGAWWGAEGKRLSKEFKAICNDYQIVDHHRNWTKESFRESMEAGKPGIMSELHTKDNSFPHIKNLFKSAFDWGCEAVNVYPLMNFGMGKGSRFQAILNYVSNFRGD